jgi:pimeloyl-ACP methyl ester carboxylesterase
MKKYIGGILIGGSLLAVAVALSVYRGIHDETTADSKHQHGSLDRHARRLEWHNCDSLIITDRPLACGRFYPGGVSGSFYLPFVVFRYVEPDALADPLVYIAGGPGVGMQTHSDSVQSWGYWLESIDLRRDFILFDQRGLKPGQPYWSCDAYDQLSREIFAENLALEKEYEQTSAVLQACLYQFDQWLRSPAVGVGSGLRSFSSLRGAADLMAMLNALGYQHWNLWGVSYGTRVALVAAQQNPSRVRSLLLDSPYPLDKGNLSALPTNYARALETFWTLCQNNEEFCGVAVEDPAALFWRVSDRLRQQPETYRIKLPDSSAMTLVLNEHRLLSLAYFALYDPRLYSDLLRGLVLLDQGREKDEVDAPDPITFLLKLFTNSALDQDFNSLIFYGIECNDNPLESAELYHQAAMVEASLYPSLKWVGAYNPCRLPLFAAEDLLNEMPVPMVPALILAGELDPVTPVAWAESLAQKLPGGRLIVAPETGHAVLASGACEPGVLKQFLQTPLASLETLGKYCRL